MAGRSTSVAGESPPAFDGWTSFFLSAAAAGVFLGWTSSAVRIFFKNLRSRARRLLARVSLDLRVRCARRKCSMQTTIHVACCGATRGIAHGGRFFVAFWLDFPMIFETRKKSPILVFFRACSKTRNGADDEVRSDSRPRRSERARRAFLPETTTVVVAFWRDEGVFAGARNSKTLVFRPPRAPCGRASACIPATN